MAKNKQEFKVGDLVRVPRLSMHGLIHGGVCEVLEIDYWGDGAALAVQGPRIKVGYWAATQQVVPVGIVKLAKQAMRKRDEYAARR